MKFDCACVSLGGIGFSPDYHCLQPLGFPNHMVMKFWVIFQTNSQHLAKCYKEEDTKWMWYELAVHHHLQKAHSQPVITGPWRGHSVLGIRKGQAPLQELWTIKAKSRTFPSWNRAFQLNGSQWVCEGRRWTDWGEVSTIGICHLCELENLPPTMKHWLSWL